MVSGQCPPHWLDQTLDDISRIIALCLRHRLRKDPLESIDSDHKVNKVFAEVFGVELG
jgi:magnesium chelatase subunit I